MNMPSTMLAPPPTSPPHPTNARVLCAGHVPAQVPSAGDLWEQLCEEVAKAGVAAAVVAAGPPSDPTARHHVVSLLCRCPGVGGGVSVRAGLFRAACCCGRVCACVVVAPSPLFLPSLCR